MTDHRWLPEPTPDSLVFWQGCRAHELRIQFCNQCEEYYFYPRPFCPKCWSDDVEWRAVSGNGTLHTYVINERPVEGIEDAPFVIAIVVLDEGPHLMTNIVGVAPSPEDLPPGLPVTVVFEEVSDTVTLPKFAPLRSA
jgi:uncharacterized OB-fold protein